MRDGPYVYNLYVIVRLCVEVCSAIITTVDNIIFPRSLQDVRDVKSDFYNIAQFPNCVGAVDGTLMWIKGMRWPQEKSLSVERTSMHLITKLFLITKRGVHESYSTEIVFI